MVDLVGELVMALGFLRFDQEIRVDQKVHHHVSAGEAQELVVPAVTVRIREHVLGEYQDAGLGNYKGR